MIDTARFPVVFLFGPTAVGKTALLGRLAGAPVQIISADSLQVYRKLDIGTAKPSAEFRRTLPHHLIDIVDPDEQFDVGRFVHLADEAIDQIRAARCLPVVSGGAGYYLRHLLFGLPPAPPSSPEVRALIQRRLSDRGLAALYADLTSVDPEAAARIGPADEYRITRALEVYETAGKPLSDFPRPGKPRDELQPLLIELTRPREELLSRIAARVHSMMEAGLRREVENLLNEGYGSRSPGLRGIGYREFFDANGVLKPPTADPDIVELILVNTRRYAKKQATFFRGLPGVHSVAAEDPQQVIDAIRELSTRP